MSTATVFTFSDVNLFFTTWNFNVNLGLGDSLSRLAVAVLVRAVSSVLAVIVHEEGTGCHDLPLTRELYFWKAFALAVSVFLVDGHVVFTTCAAITVLFVDFDLVLVVLGTIAFVDRGGERRVAGFLVFPSTRKIGFSFYSDASSVLGGVVCVRRRED